MGWDIGGEKENIRRIKREDFLDFQEKFYFAQNMAVVVAGNLNEEKIKKLTQKYLGDFRKTGRKVTKEVILAQKKPQVKLVTKKTEQAHFCLGVPGVALSHQQRFTVGVLASILGGGMSSRLWHQIRGKRGLAYYVLTMPEFYTDSGFLMTQSGVRLKQIEEAIKVVLAEFQDLAKKKVTAKELNKAKEYLKGGMILTLEDSMQVATRYAFQALLEKKMRTPQEAIKLIDKVTAEDVRQTCQELFQPKNLNLAIIGPYKEEKRFKKLLEA
jgi:predicted Zn-dependent peptidase